MDIMANMGVVLALLGAVIAALAAGIGSSIGVGMTGVTLDINGGSHIH